MGFSMKAKAGTGGSNVDFNAFNQHLFDVIGGKTRSLSYVVCGLVELGTQERDNFEIPLADATADHKKALEDDSRGAKVIIAKHPKTGEPVDTLSIPQKPKEQLAIVIEVPALQIDYGYYFNNGESEKKPFRFYMGGEWMVQDGEKKVKILARPANVACQPQDKAPSGWGYPSNNTIFKFAEAGGLTDENNILDQEFDLGELLGSQGLIKVSAKKTEKGDKTYVTVTAKDPSPRAEAVPPIDLEKEGIELWGVMFDERDEDGNPVEPDAEVVKRLSAPCKNTIKRAAEYEGSVLQKLLEVSSEGDKSKGKQVPSEGSKTASPSPDKASEVEDDDEPAPFEMDDIDSAISEEEEVVVEGTKQEESETDEEDEFDLFD